MTEAEHSRDLFVSDLLHFYVQCSTGVLQIDEPPRGKTNNVVSEQV